MSAVSSPATRPSGSRRDLVIVSLLLLYLELACIRWFPAQVLYLTFFTNTILLASFLGMSLGCLAARWRTNFLTLTPLLLLAAIVAAQAVGAERSELGTMLQVGNQRSPQLIYFGTEYSAADPSQTVIPIEVVEGFFFLLVTLVMIGPGQELGRAFGRVSSRLQAYSLNILGSLAGVVLFALASWRELPPVWWFAPVAVLLGFLLFFSGTAPARIRWGRLVWIGSCLAGVVAMTTWTWGDIPDRGGARSQQMWSPYYRIDYGPKRRLISVNLIGHQEMASRSDDRHPSYAYALPHLLRRDTFGPPFADVLIVGAGSGNDVSRALAWGALHVDAVEIDPAIQRIGLADHPDHPYQDPRVTVHIDDGRSFLRKSHAKYDLVVFALVDSLVLHSGYSNIRLESFMFTREAFADVRDHLKPDGLFVMANYFRQGWVVDRLSQGLRETFGADPLILTLPYVDAIYPASKGGFTILVSGATGSLRDAFQANPAYWLPAGHAPSAATPNGFTVHPTPEDEPNWVRFGPATLPAASRLRSATDDWPFVYLRQPMIPALSLRGMAIMGGIAVVLLGLFMRAGPDRGHGWRLDGRMFFLGAGFMLIETSAVVRMALLFGSTWIVNTVVFAAVLVMILGANLFAARMPTRTLWPYYTGLLAALALNCLIPLDSFLGLDRTWQIVWSCLLAFAPILFAGLIFAACFSRSERPDQDFGANVAGAMFGGLAENSSMLLGFRYLMLVVGLFYVLSAVTGRLRSRATAGS